MRASASYARAVRARLVSPDIRDTEQHLVELVLTADPDAYADLRARALAPLRALPESSARRLEETLRAWLLHHGRRDEVATALFVHPQTVRYRMGQVRDLFPDLDSPHRVLELTLALGLAATLWCVAAAESREGSNAAGR
jgi:DNA-binding PucR family transcriptional regulator